MKPLLLILALTVTCAAQDNLEWKPIMEMSRYVPDHPGVMIITYGAKIARGGDKVKLSMRFSFPQGAPVGIFKDNVPHGFDISSISRVESRIELNCKTLAVKPLGKSAEIYQFNGKKHKSKEPPFKIESGNVLARYFCEQGERPTVAPTLKP